MSGKVTKLHIRGAKGSRKGRGAGNQRPPPPPPPPPTPDMQELYGMALDVVRDELELGSPRMAQWFVEHYNKYETSRIKTHINLQLENAGDLERASQDAITMAADGRISFEMCKEIQEALARHAVLSGIRTIEELRGEIDVLKATSQKKRIGTNGSTPTWGRFTEQ